MALRLTTDEQIARVRDILLKADTRGIIEIEDNGIVIDDGLDFDTMAEIVDYVRTLAPNKELFEECWKAYNRKGSKKKALDYWKKMSEREKESVLPHIKAYVSSRDIQYCKDFERYLRDKVYKTVVFANNQIIYDPTKEDSCDSVYRPICGGALNWNDYYQKYIYIGNFDGFISDGYTDENRPDGATIMLNNNRGDIMWDANFRVWINK